VSYNDDGSEHLKNLYKYDEKGNKIEEIFYLNGRFSYMTGYRYDAYNNVIEDTTTYRPDGSGGQKTNYVYMYNNSGKKTEKLDMGPFGIVMKTIYTYNAKGLLEAEGTEYSASYAQVKGDGTVGVMTAFQYDDRGNVKSVINFDFKSVRGKWKTIMKKITNYDFVYYD